MVCNNPVDGGSLNDPALTPCNSEMPVRPLQTALLSTSPSRCAAWCRQDCRRNTVNLVLDEQTAVSPETGSTCSLEDYLALPDHSMDARIAVARAKLGATAILLGHH